MYVYGDVCCLRPTEYALANGARKFVWESKGKEYRKYDGNCWWWLRSPGYDPRYAARVAGYGDVHIDGSEVSFGNHAVRPALWLNIES